MLDLATVVIGRNEGERLRRCLESLRWPRAVLVYVDSGSTDGSGAMAQTLGAVVVELDMSVAFTAARARNAGFATVRDCRPEVKFVQFVDGDCELAPNWLDTAMSFMLAHPAVAAVCGRRRERFPRRTIYNRLCDIEWDTPIGPAKACGGDVMIRAAALEAVAGYRDSLIAGEEPELCVRLRAAGWQIYRLDSEMTLHDAAMTRFSQWWRRSVRAGYAFAEGAALHGAPPECHWVREARSARIWALGLPAAIAGAAVVFGAIGWWGLLAYPLQVGRLYLKSGGEQRIRLACAFFLVLGKFAEMRGQVSYFWHRWRGVAGRVIEYK